MATLIQPESMSASVTSELCDRHLIEHRLPGIIPHLFSGQTIHKESLLQNNQTESPPCPTPDTENSNNDQKNPGSFFRKHLYELGSLCVNRNCVTLTHGSTCPEQRPTHERDVGETQPGCQPRSQHSCRGKVTMMHPLQNGPQKGTRENRAYLHPQ